MAYEDALEYIYEDEIGKLLISVEGYVNDNQSRGIPQMIGRRYGNLWEKIVKCTFSESRISCLGERIYYKDYVSTWVENHTRDIDDLNCKKVATDLLIEFLGESTGTPTQDLCDFTVVFNNIKYAIDTKVRFVSNDSNTVRGIADAAHHLRYMGYEPILLFRRDRQESLLSPLKRFENAGWDIKCAGEAATFIKELTNLDLEFWIDNHIDVWGRLGEYHQFLTDMRFAEAAWCF